MNQSAIGEGIFALENAYETDVEFRASFDEKTKTFTLECFAQDSDEMENFYETVFWDAPLYFPLERDWNYCFRMTTYKDVGASIEKAVFTIVIETNVGMMPGRVLASEKEWKDFMAQLSYTVNGEKCVLSAPDFLPYKHK